MIRNRVKVFLDGREITPYRFQVDTGIAPGTAYGLYNRPEQIPSGAVLDKICSVYQVQPGDLLEYCEEEEE